MNRGYVRFWRKSMDSGWIKNHKLWAFWSYCLLKASHKEFDAIVGLQIVHLMPGQFIFGLRKASDETGLTIRQIRTALAFLKKARNLTIKTTNKFSIITIVNWNTYQGEEVENDKQNDKPMANKGQHTNTRTHKKTQAEILGKIETLKTRYPRKDLIENAIIALASTRKSNRIAESVILAQLERWADYPIFQVESGIKTYLEKNYASLGKSEAYLFGIIRKNGNRPPKSQPDYTPEFFDFSKQFHEE